MLALLDGTEDADSGAQGHNADDDGHGGWVLLIFSLFVTFFFGLKRRGLMCSQLGLHQVSGSSRRSSFSHPLTLQGAIHIGNGLVLRIDLLLQSRVGDSLEWLQRFSSLGRVLDQGAELQRLVAQRLQLRLLGRLLLCEALLDLVPCSELCLHISHGGSGLLFGALAETVLEASKSSPQSGHLSFDNWKSLLGGLIFRVGCC